MTPTARFSSVFSVVKAVAVFAIILCTANLHAQGFDSTYFTGLDWKNIGPNRGGRSIAVAGSTSRINEYYFGATGGGLWKTTDGGTSWKPVTDGKIRSSSVGAVAVAESNPDIVFIGMGEVDLRGNIMQGDGVYRTGDGGKTWTHMGLENTQAIGRVRIDKTNPDLVYVAALGKPSAPSPERGVYRSKDGGKTWQRILYRNDSTGAVDLVIDPGNPRVLFAAMWQAYRIPWKMSSGGAGSGLFRSTDGGDTWTELTRAKGMPAGVIGRIGVSVSGADSKRVYAMIEADSGGVYRSDDGGDTWTRTNDERKLRQRAFYYTRIYADTKNKDRVYVLNTGLYRSDSGGTKFNTTLRPPHGDHHDLWIAPNDPERIVEANDGGGTVTVNGGTTWTDLRYPTAQAYHVSVTTDFPYHVCGAQQDAGTFCIPSSGWENLAGINDGSGDWAYDVGGGESGYIAPNPSNPDIIYAGSQGALLTRYNRRNGQIRDIQVYPRFFSGEPASALPERWQWTFPIVFSPQNSKVIYTSSQHLWKTTNEGQSWTRISPDLTRHDPMTLGESGGPITHDMNGPEVYATIYTIAPSPRDSMTIWTGSDDGYVFITRNGGKSWTNVTPADLPPFARISLMDASRHAAGTAYVAAKRYQLDDRKPYIYKTTDFGKTWRKIITGIRADDYVHSVREDLERPGLLYAGTEHGIYVSFNDGDQWQSLSRNLPDVQVSDIALTGNDVVIGTHGRSMYVLRNITPLREMNTLITKAPLHVFTPAISTRNVDQPTFQFYLTRQADSVRVDILDVSGKLIRSYIGMPGDTAIKPPKSEVPGCESARPTDPRTPTRAGLNSFQWNGRHAGAVGFDCMIVWSANPTSGPQAVPGRYQVRITANGMTQTKPFTIRRDPRLVGVTDADLKEQFALASKITARTNDANEAVIRVRSLRDQLSQRAGVTAKPEIRSAIIPIVTELTRIEEELYQTRNRSGQDPLNFPIKLNNRLAALKESVERGDARPTAASYVVFRELSADLDKHLAALRSITDQRISQVNKLLAAAGEKTVVDSH
ncbi:MAG TPA: glycosyl hydrolase [Gemmatimonadaceae bacterium]|nr:glycosyl hydrolase [Gemmatimonadaceae bacterium]